MDINIKQQPTDRELGITNSESSNHRGPTSAGSEVGPLNFDFAPPKMLFYWKEVSRWALILFAALTPIFFLPFTALPVTVHKEVLVFGLILVIFFAMLGRILLEGRIRYPGHLLTLALLVLVLVWGASTFFSVNQIGSLIGSWATPDSFFAIFLFAVLTLSIAITFSAKGGSASGGDKRDIVLSLLIFLASLSVLGIFELLQLIKVFILPYDFAKIATFNPVGSVNDLGVILAFGLILASGLMATPEMSKLLKRFLGVSAFVFILLLAVIDFWAIWVGLALAMIFMISFLSAGLAKSDVSRGPTSAGSEVGPLSSDFAPGLQLAYFQKAWLPSIILLVSIFLLFIPSPLGKFIQTPVEVSPNFSATLDIANQNLKESNYFLGSGPNTFGYIFNLYKPIDINQTIFWSTVFNTGASAMATWVGTLGLFGVLSILFLIIAFIWTGIKGTAVRNASRGVMNVASQAIFVGVSFLFIMWFLYVVNFTVMALTFWGMGLFLAASLFFIMETDVGSSVSNTSNQSVFKEYRIFNSPPKTFLFSLLIVGLMVGAVSGIYFETNRYIAEIYFEKAITHSTSSGQEASSEVINNISKAIDLWQYDERYFQSLAQAVFFQLNTLLARKDLPQEALRDQFQNITTNSIAAAKEAQNLDPKNPTNSVLIGSIYENLIPFIADAANFALSSYSAAVSVDPKNPSHHLALARVSVSLKDLNKAADHLEEATKLKNDYAPAIFLLVQVYDGQGKIPEAVKRAEELVSLNINDVGALFQLGFLYYKNNEFDKSRQVFERTVELSANYSNARYFLGLIYDGSTALTASDAKANKAKAIEQFEKIAELNPDNGEVKQILVNLKAKKPALSGIAPPAPAPQNRAEAPVSEGTKTPVQKLQK